MNKHHKTLMRELEAAISYASFAQTSHHAKTTEAAIVDLARRVPFGTNAACLLIQHADPVALKAYLARDERVALSRADMQASSQCPLSLMCGKGRTPQQIIEAFQLVHGCATLPVPRQTQIIFGLVRSLGYPEIIEPLTTLIGSSEADCKKAFFSIKMLENPLPGLHAWLAEYVRENFDIEDQQWKKFVVSGIRAKKPIPAAIALERKVDIRPLINFNSVIGKNDWPVRMKNRLSTAHAMMEVMINLPDLETLLGMSNKEIIPLVADPNEVERRKKEIEAAAKRAVSA